MIDTTSTTQASKKSLGILLVVLVAVLVLSLARGRLVSSLMSEACATGQVAGCAAADLP
jgi:hypothetical protein